MNGGARVLNEPVSGYSAGGGGSPAVAAGRGGNGPDCPHCGSRSCPHCGASSGWVYAIGRIGPQFPDLGVEKEFAQLGVGGAAIRTGGMFETDRLIEILQDPATVYLARQICWVFSAGDADAFVIAPRDDSQTKALVESLPRAERADQTIQVIVGALGPPQVGAACAAASLPSVLVDQHLTFPLNDFLDALAGDDAEGGKREKGHAKADDKFRGVARDAFARLTRRSDNRGVSDDHRALNYLALRYPQFYRLAADAYANDKTLIDVEVRRGPPGPRRLVAVRPLFRTRRTDLLERYQCVVDVTDRFPFLVSPLASVYD